MHLFHDGRVDADHDLIISKFEALIQLAFGRFYQTGARQEIIRVLLRYTSSHFKREEACMRRVRYPGLAEHLLAHAYMQHEFRKIRRIMSGDHPNLLSDIRLFRDMFLFHILTYDESFAEWLSLRAAGGRLRTGERRPWPRGRSSGPRLRGPRGGPRRPILLPRSHRWASP